MARILRLFRRNPLFCDGFDPRQIRPRPPRQAQPDLQTPGRWQAPCRRACALRQRPGGTSTGSPADRAGRFGARVVCCGRPPAGRDRWGTAPTPAPDHRVRIHAQRTEQKRPGPISGASSGSTAGPLPKCASTQARGHPLALLPGSGRARPPGGRIAPARGGGRARPDLTGVKSGEGKKTLRDRCSQGDACPARAGLRGRSALKTVHRTVFAPDRGPGPRLTHPSSAH